MTSSTIIGLSDLPSQPIVTYGSRSRSEEGDMALGDGHHPLDPIATLAHEDSPRTSDYARLVPLREDYRWKVGDESASTGTVVAALDDRQVEGVCNRQTKRGESLQQYSRDLL